ncbi:hypothetical protein [Microbacterium azadirachtae]|uniref:Uncharacterized protein n=1 Tax=Microbacterium azadirachtae TaxID=582680 RepID=A0A0F0KZF1_9MICO|nr:hypothetical protein [Microbacterium azadirachtae]KJL25804.1 hypothetical protein RL72_01290 [Microbacterium azadirachtae]SDM20644.1 hypothetical protein SAMN04488593_2974 [Microbacterium azadirachtae]SEG42805.1 hypothetical protein SAMN04488594_2959 [Microbacterium azadirachtae]SEG45931.1 hypothetical protein SAMN04488592_2968 [Microbacterium azadirachtae]
MGDNWIAIATAAVTGAFVLTGAVLSFASTRGEPQRAKELRALNEIIKDMPPSEGRLALLKRREAIAQKYGESGVETFTDLERAGFLGIAALALGVLLGSLVSGTFESTLRSFASLGALLFMLGGLVWTAIVLVAVVVRSIRSWRARRAARGRTKSA